MNWWQVLPYHISPVIFEVGSFQLRYYGMMYLVALAITYALIRYRLNRKEYDFSLDTIEDVLIWAMLGLLIGARIGDGIFYNLDYFLARPWEIILPITFAEGSVRFVGFSGMSYHGGLIGAALAVVIFCRSKKIDFWRITDLICPAIPLGYTFGRIGNFINGELFGRATTSPWGMYFPMDYTNTLRHPSQLYEAFFEGIFLFAVLWFLRLQIKTTGAMLAFYIIGYGIVRFFIEFVREPETGLLGGFLTMGQILCALMVLCGLCLYIYLQRSNFGQRRHISNAN